MTITYVGCEPSELDRLLRSGQDHGNNPIEPFIDQGGDWPLRCCLQDSVRGDRLAIIGFAPFPWSSPYRVTGPVVVHVEGCPGADASFPAAFEGRSQIMRAYGSADGRTRTLVYDLNRQVLPGEGLESAIESAMNDPRVEFVQCYNVVSGCYSFTARRSG